MPDTYEDPGNKPARRRGRTVKKTSPENPAGTVRAEGSGPSDENSASQAPGPAAPAGGPTGRGFFLPREAAGAFSSVFLDEDRCRCWILRRLHPDGAFCPDCGLELEGAMARSFWDGRRCSCARCGRGFVATSGTFLEGTHFDFSQVFLLAVLINLKGPGLEPARIAGILGISADSVRLWVKKFRAFDDER